MPAMPAMSMSSYSSVDEARRIVGLIESLTTLPSEVQRILRQDEEGGIEKGCIQFEADQQDFPYFPIPFKESETGMALKAIEAAYASVLAEIPEPQITIDLDKTTAFLMQAYLAKVGPYGKLDPEVKKYLVDTDLLQAQSNPYRRMSANLYATKRPGEYYHIHGSLEASTTLQMLGLEPYRPDLTRHEDIVRVIEGAVQRFTVEELEERNAANRQAGVPALKHSDFVKTSYGRIQMEQPPWTVEELSSSFSGSSTASPLPPHPLPHPKDKRGPLVGIRVLELCRIVAGPVMGRILAEYGADVLKITSPHLSDVPIFQVDGNMGKHAAHLDLKTAEGRRVFAELAQDVDVVLDGYRPDALSKLGFGPQFFAEVAQKRGYGVVYVNENCFGYAGDWAMRPGWQQIADCVTGVAWAQGQFMGLDEPVVPPFPISDYGTGCMGAIAALDGLLRRAVQGGSWHGKVSLVQYDLLLFRAGLLDEEVQKKLRETAAGPDFLHRQLCHSHSVDQISGRALRHLLQQHPQFASDPGLLEVWTAHAGYHGSDVTVVRPVADIVGLETGFQRASRPNGTDKASWAAFSEEKKDKQR